MKVTITAKIQILPTKEEIKSFNRTLDAYTKGCNFASNIVYKEEILNNIKLQKLTYNILREKYGLKSQMASSVPKTVVARYKTNQSNNHEWTLVQFKKREYDLAWNRDYSVKKDFFSINTIDGRIKNIKFKSKGMTHFFDGSWNFGTAKLVNKYGKWFLHIPFSKEVEDCEIDKVKSIVGIDMGLNFTAVTYDSQGKTLFFNGKAIKNKRAKYKRLRKQLQQKQTSSARKKLKTIGQRESRWMTDVNHRISKALIDKYGSNTLYAIEDLSGIRKATEKVRVRDRYYMVSWSFYQLRQFIEYKANLNKSHIEAFDPRYTSQQCPKCEHISRLNRNKKTHSFNCKNCGYRSNDDRIGAMNLYNKGIEYLSTVTSKASLSA